jgi:hypothetical protein
MIGLETKPAKPQGEQSSGADRFGCDAFFVSLSPMIEKSSPLSEKHNSLW